MGASTALGSTSNQRQQSIVILIYCSVFGIYYITFLNQAYHHPGPLGTAFLSETPAHISFSEPFYRGIWRETLKTNFEPMLHILTALIARLLKGITHNSAQSNLANAMALILSFAKLAQFALVHKIVQYYSVLKESTNLFLTIAINICTVLYLPFVTFNMYIPMITPNILIDPTNILLGPFAILFFYSYIKQTIGQEPISLKRSACLSLLLILATLIKPAFTNVMLVLIGVYYLCRPKRFLSSLFAHDILIYLPSSLILIWQIIVISNSSAGGVLEFAPFKVIKFWSKHPFIALFQGIEFPLLITLVCKSKNKHLYFSWGFCAIAYLIYALFSFSGPSWKAANLAWSYQIALTFIYLFSIIEYGNTFLSEKKPPLSNLCMVNFSLIFLSGVHQFIKLILGGSYM